MGRQNQIERPNPHCVYYGRKGHEAKTCKNPWEKIKEQEEKDKALEQAKCNALELSHYVIAHYNIGLHKDVFSIAFSSWIVTWLLDTSSTYQMMFQRKYFKQFDENIDCIVYFIDKSSLKPSRIGTIKLNFPELSDFVLHVVLTMQTLKWEL